MHKVVFCVLDCCNAVLVCACVSICKNLTANIDTRRLSNEIFPLLMSNFHEVVFYGSIFTRCVFLFTFSLLVLMSTSVMIQTSDLSAFFEYYF